MRWKDKENKNKMTDKQTLRRKTKEEKLNASFVCTINVYA